MYPVLIDNSKGSEPFHVFGQTIKAGTGAQFVGMNLREHYAGLAMQALIGVIGKGFAWVEMAEAAFEMADSMLAESERNARESDKGGEEGDMVTSSNGELLEALRGLFTYVTSIHHVDVEHCHNDSPVVVAKRLIERADGES